MSAEVELVPQEPPLPIATIRVTPEQAVEQNNRINQVITAVLKEGHDYAVISGTKRPSLLRPGAEALQRFFGLGHLLTDLTTEMVSVNDKEFFAARIKCSVTNGEGRIISESYGYCDDTEPDRNGVAGRKWFGKRNTIMQMATKRAYVSAIKTATGTSDHFTQDIEDDTPAAAGLPPGHVPVPDLAASPEEVEAFLQLYSTKRGDEDTSYAAEWLQERVAKGIGVTGDGSLSKWWLGKMALTILAQQDPIMKGPEVVADPGIPALSVEQAERQRREQAGEDVVEAEVVDERTTDDDDPPWP